MVLDLTDAVKQYYEHMKKVKMSVLRRAHQLQADYRKMRAPSTQNIRNPFPLHQLIPLVLPRHTEQQADAIRDLLRNDTPMATLTPLGKKFARQYNSALKKLKATAGMTVEQVCDALASRGFIVNPISVRQTLSNLRYHTLGAFRQPREDGFRGAPRALYYVRS